MFYNVFDAHRSVRPQPLLFAGSVTRERLVPTASLLCLHSLTCVPSLALFRFAQDLHRLFHGASVLVWDGTAVQGVNDCAALFQLLPSSKHTVETFDVQPITGHTAICRRGFAKGSEGER